MLNLHHHRSVVLLLTLAMSLLVACTKARDPRIADQQLAAQLVAVADLKDGRHQITLGGAVETEEEGVVTYKLSGKPTLVVSEAQVPGPLRKLFFDQGIQGKPGTTVPVRFRIDRSFVFVDRAVPEDEALSTLESGIAYNRTLNGVSTRMLPLFAIPIKGAGILIPRKNDAGEDTSNLELFETDVSVATHLQLDLRTEAIHRIGFRPETAHQDLQEHISPQSLYDQVHSKEELERILSRPLVLSPSVSKVATRLVVDPNDRARVLLVVYSIRKRSEVKNEALLAILDSGVASINIQKCGTDVAAKAGPEYANDCILVAEGQFQADNVKTELAVDSQGRPTPFLTSTRTPVTKNLGLLRIPLTSVFTPRNPENISSAGNVIPVSFFKNKEFFFRRTFKAAPTSLMSFGPGASGPMELVKFELEADRVVVRRVMTVNGDTSPGRIDREELMSLPAKYYQLSDRGQVLPTPLQTTVDRAEAVALQWTSNSIPVGNSPLSFLQAGQCFMHNGNQLVKEVDQRLSEGIINFTIEGTYTFRPECMSQFRMNDYWYQGGIQTTYNLEERVSFMVNDGRMDKLPNQNVAFRAQSMMGFGSFTMGTIVQDEAGNTDRIYNESAKPVIQDFSNGRVVTFILAGLPSDSTLRDLVIRSSKKVIEDWNTTLRQAFAGTKLERSGPYLDLKIEGVDVTPGQLGDLDRNYIWNFDKKLDSSLLGMAQAAPNPRSGYVVATNILMYPGNLYAYVVREKERALIQKQYEEMKAKVLAGQAKEEEQPAGPAKEASETIEKAPSTELLRRLKMVQESFRPVTPAHITTRSGAVAPALQQIRSSTHGLSDMQKENQKKLLTESDYLQRIFHRAIELNALQDPDTMEALTASEILRTYGNRLREDERQLLALQSRQLALKAEFAKNLRHGPNCFFSAQGGNGDINLVDSSIEDIFSNWYSATLSHEIGHGLALTHNFKGSTDKENMEFSGRNDGRRYSSIMDYLHPVAKDYRGPGPYDIHALRAAYTGLIEVSDAVKTAAQKSGGRLTVKNIEGEPVSVELKQGAFASIDELRDVYLPSRVGPRGEKLRSWWDLSGRALSLLPLKHYNFCTDIDVGGDPMCARFDAGSTPMEVVQFHIDQYNKMYPVYNHRNTAINMVGLPAYVSRVITSLFTIRTFLDEAFYRAIQGEPPPTWIPYAQAAVKGMNAFVEVIGTPTANAPVMSPDRFQVRQLEIPGKDKEPAKKVTFLVESRALKDLITPGTDHLVQTRGIEIDKIFALQFLTLEKLGLPRYDRVSLRTSFATFEKLMLGQKGAGLTLSLVNSILSDGLPAIKVIDNQPVNLGADFRVEVSQTMQFYAVLGSTVFLDNTATQDEMNPSRAFLVGRSLGRAPKDRLVVTRLGSSLQSPTALKLWAHDTATVAQDLVAKAARARVVVENRAKLAELLGAVNKAQTDEEKKAAREALAKQLVALNDRGLLLGPTEGGMTPQTAVELLENFTTSRMGALESLRKLVDSKLIPLDAVAEIARPLREKDEPLIRSVPLLGVAVEYIRSSQETDVDKSIAAALLNTQAVDAHHHFLVGSLEQMNRILLVVHPELSN